MAGGKLGPNSDLPVRIGSALVMVAVAGTALWFGGWAWLLFIGLVAIGVLAEWIALVRRFEQRPVQRGLWNAAGMIYVGIAAAMLMALRSPVFDISLLLILLLAVIATDVGAYFAGRTIGGPKIAPMISPSKTWAGLGGGAVGASLVVLGANFLSQYQQARSIEMVIEVTAAPAFWSTISWWPALGDSLVIGAGIAVIAQAGDFFQSWMKRRAGVKDSGALLPGHGGLFDRVDGLLAVLAIGGLLVALAGIAGFN